MVTNDARGLNLWLWPLLLPGDLEKNFGKPKDRFVSTVVVQCLHEMAPDAKYYTLT